MNASGKHGLRLEGASNFRDIGGGLTGAGRRIKPLKMFRSGELSRLTDADHDELRKLRVAFVADLRSRKECGGLHSRWPQDIGSELYEADITMDSKVDGRPVMDVIREDPTPDGVTRTVAAAFRDIADLCGPALKTITWKLANGTEPVVFHCTNGRDRTGVIAAMLLYMLGAPRESIVEDFMLTNERINVELAVENSIHAFRKAMNVDIDRETVLSVTLVRAEYIDSMFRGFELKYGSPEGYLRHFGIDAAMRQDLQQRLLEPA
jgi:protein-tyrosine phosphatase